MKSNNGRHSKIPHRELDRRVRVTVTICPVVMFCVYLAMPKGNLKSVYASSFAIGIALVALIWHLAFSLIRAAEGTWSIQHAVNRTITIFITLPFGILEALSVTNDGLSAWTFTLAKMCVVGLACGSTVHFACHSAMLRLQLACLLLPQFLTVLFPSPPHYWTWFALHLLFTAYCFREGARLNFLHRLSMGRQRRIKRKNRQLRNAHRKLTVALDHEHKAKQQAVQAASARTTFLANMSHEIRTPMNAVIGTLSLLQEMSIPEEAQELVSIIHSSSTLLLTVLNDILDLSKIDSGNLKLENVPFDIAGSLEDAAMLVSSSAHQKGILFTCALDLEIDQWLIGDAIRIRQIVLNLLSNAIKFTQEGAVQLRAYLEKNSQQPWLVIHVADSGIGIPSQKVHLLFDSFSQIDPSTTRVYGGTGLGLAISQKLAHAMGGRISVTSKLGEGSVFEVRLPAEITRERNEQLGELSSAYDFSNEKPVLLLDCNAVCRSAIKKTLVRCGVANIVELGTVEDCTSEQLRGATALLVDADSLDYLERFFSILTSAPMTLRIIATSSLPLDRDEGSQRVRYLVHPMTRQALSKELHCSGKSLSRLAAGLKVPREREDEAAHPLSILVAEDNSVNRWLILRLLSKLGYSADVAVNGIEALSCFRAKKYDVVLTDIHMPGMDGLQLARSISEWPSTDSGRPWLIACTAAVTAEEQSLFRSEGFDEVLVKPVTLASLAAALATFDCKIEGCSVQS